MVAAPAPKVGLLLPCGSRRPQRRRLMRLVCPPCLRKRQGSVHWPLPDANSHSYRRFSWNSGMGRICDLIAAGAKPDGAPCHVRCALASHGRHNGRPSHPAAAVATPLALAKPGRHNGPSYQAEAVATSAMPSDSSQRSASIAALHPSAAAVTAWRYLWSCTSPATNTPSILVRVSSDTTR